MTEDVLYERGLNQKRAKHLKVFPRLLRYALPHWRLFLLGLLFLGIATAADVAGPIVLKRFIDRYLTPLYFPLRPVLILAVTYFVLIVLSTVFHYIQFVTLNRLAQRAIRAIRMDVFQKVERMPMAFFDRTPVGWIVSRITNDTEAIQQLYVSVLSTYVQHTVFLVLIYGAMFTIDVRMALIMLALLPIIVALMVTYRKVSTPVVRRTREKLSEINTMLSETLSGMRTVQAFRQEQRLMRRFSNLTEGYYRSFLSQIRVNGLLVRPFVDLLYLVSIIAVLTVFGWRSMVGWVEIGTLVAFLSYIDRMFEPVNEMMFALTFFQQAHIAGERVFTLMDEGRTELKMGVNDSPQTSSRTSIQVQEKTVEA
ncbi:MAG: ABC transporter ATP-binding protein, partial [Candidatus Carbobacillus sp.]|nr:ABC transporter ATP-binding protein [Candidatus Carbobacillus sp.]